MISSQQEIDYDALGEMSLLEMCCQESLRIYPPGIRLVVDPCVSVRWRQNILYLKYSYEETEIKCKQERIQSNANHPLAKNMGYIKSEGM